MHIQNKTIHNTELLLTTAWNSCRSY